MPKEKVGADCKENKDCVNNNCVDGKCTRKQRSKVEHFFSEKKVEIQKIDEKFFRQESQHTTYNIQSCF